MSAYHAYLNGKVCGALKEEKRKDAPQGVVSSGPTYLHTGHLKHWQLSVERQRRNK